VRLSIRRLWLAALLAVECVPPADADTLVAAALAVGECTLTAETRSQEPHVLRVRVSHPRHLGCQIDEASLVAVLRTALANPSTREPAVAYTSLSLGRLVDYPWLSANVARAAAGDRAWSSRAGRPVREGINGYVARMLSRHAATDSLRSALGDAGYRIAGVSVEKVLVMPAREIAALGGERLEGRLPFDAITWLLLEPR
jgi:hypothetical protein